MITQIPEITTVKSALLNLVINTYKDAIITNTNTTC